MGCCRSYTAGAPREFRPVAMAKKRPMRTARFCILAALFASAATTCVHADTAKPVRHLVYAMSVNISGRLSQQGYAGTTTRNGDTGDRGQLMVDVLAVQPDSGVVVRISEEARGSRSADPATCVTYGTGQIICETGKKINEEEYTLLRLLGKDFVNPALMDSHHHWQLSSSSADTTEVNDYTLSSQTDGMATIVLSRDLKVRGPQGFDASTTGHVGYNLRLDVPVSVTEETETRAQSGDSYSRVDKMVTLKLESDSMQQAASSKP